MIDRRHPAAFVLPFAFALLSSSPAWAQLAAAYDPEGVHVDAEGVFRSRTTDPDPRLAKLREKAKSRPKDERLTYLSLPRLLAEVRALRQAGKSLPDEIRYLGGITKLQYIFVYPDEKDLVIAGPSEPFDAEVPYRPLGLVSGRPVLHFDDLVTALRAFAGEAAPDRIGCDIELTPEIQERIAKKVSAVGPAAGVLGFKKAAEQVAEAGGPQPVKFYGVDPESRFAFVCVEADYRLKQLGLGTLPSPVAKVKSYRFLIDRPEAAHRFSLESDYDALLVTPDGNAYELRGASLKVAAGLVGKPDSTDADLTPAAKQFRNLCNEHLTELMRHLVSWADLANLGDLSVLAAMIRAEGWSEKLGLGLSWFLDSKGYAVAYMPAPKTAATTCGYKTDEKTVLFLAGGVWLDAAAAIRKRTPDEKVGGASDRPEGADWRRTRTKS